MSSVGIAVLLVSTLGVVGVLGAIYQRSPASARWVPRTLRLLAVVGSAAISAAFLGWAWRDSGGFALLLLGVPVLLSALALAADLAGYRTALLTTLAAAVLVAWSLITVVGLGLYYLGPAIILAAAAATTWQHERARPTPAPDRPAAPTPAR